MEASSQHNELATQKPVDEGDIAASDPLFTQASKGDQAACERLYAILRKQELLGEFVEAATSAATHLVKIRYGENLLYCEAFACKMEQMRSELGAFGSTPLENLLIERIVLCWFSLYTAETLMAARLQEGGVSWAGGTYYQKSVDRAQRRYLQAIQSLALVRRLNIPAVQLNIANKQINIAPANNVVSGAVALLDDNAPS